MPGVEEHCMYMYMCTCTNDVSDGINCTIICNQCPVTCSLPFLWPIQSHPYAQFLHMYMYMYVVVVVQRSLLSVITCIQRRAHGDRGGG